MFFIPDLPKYIATIMINYINTGKINFVHINEIDEILDLFRYADKLSFLELKKDVENQLISIVLEGELDTVSLTNLWEFSRNFNATRLLSDFYQGIKI